MYGSLLTTVIDLSRISEFWMLILLFCPKIQALVHYKYHFNKSVCQFNKIFGISFTKRVQTGWTQPLPYFRYVKEKVHWIWHYTVAVEVKYLISIDKNYLYHLYLINNHLKWFFTIGTSLLFWDLIINSCNYLKNFDFIWMTRQQSFSFKYDIIFTDRGMLLIARLRSSKFNSIILL